jgi:hypothetical protein
MVLTIKAAAASLPSICSSDFVFNGAKFFIAVALVAAIAHVIVYSIVELRPKQEPPPKSLVGFDKVLEGLKGVLEALANLPHWVAIFLAGLALLWMAGQRPEVCKLQQEPPPAEQPAGK